MRLINIVYDNDYSDVDIISVSEYVADNLDSVAQEFFDWLKIPSNRKGYLVRISPQKELLAIGTKEFVDWLNRHSGYNISCADIVLQHTEYNAEYPCAYF